MQRHRLPEISSRIGTVVRVVVGVRRCNRDKKPRRTEPALQPVLFSEGFEDVRRSLQLIQALDRRDSAAAGLDRKHEARAHGFPVDEHRAHAADTVLAPCMCPDQPELVAEAVEQQAPDRNGDGTSLAVHLELDRGALDRFEMAPHRLASTIARITRVPTSRRR